MVNVKRCTRCSSQTPLAERDAQLTREVSGHLFIAYVVAPTCGSCSESYFESSIVEQFEMHVAHKLAEAGVASGAAFRFMRKTLRIPANVLAELVDVAPETVSRWEAEKRAVSRSAFAIVSALVLDAAAGRTMTHDILRRLRSPASLEETVTIDLRASLS